MDPNGFYRPKEDELYWMMAHRAVAQRAPLNRKLMLELMSTAADQHILTNADLPTDDTDLELLLTTQLVRRNLLSPRSASILGRAIDMAISDFRHGYQILAVRIRTLYFAARENILARLPNLSSIKRAFIQNGGNGKAK